jgi:hypothetical protein
MTPTIERKYALTKIAPGDYLLPSNDGRTIWRIAKGDAPDDTAATYWDLFRWTNTPERFQAMAENPWAGDVLDWNLWECVDSLSRTRAEAIREAMRMGA